MRGTYLLLAHAILTPCWLAAYHVAIGRERTPPTSESRGARDQEGQDSLRVPVLGDPARTSAAVEQRLSRLEATIEDLVRPRAGDPSARTALDDLLPEVRDLVLATQEGVVDEALVRTLSLHLDEIQRRRVLVRLREGLIRHLERRARDVPSAQRLALVEATLHVHERMRSLAQALEGDGGDDAANLRHAGFQELRRQFLDSVEQIVTSRQQAAELHEALCGRISLHAVTREASDAE